MTCLILEFTLLDDEVGVLPTESCCVEVLFHFLFRNLLACNIELVRLEPELPAEYHLIAFNRDPVGGEQD
jgi:hypothetical protein